MSIRTLSEERHVLYSKLQFFSRSLVALFVLLVVLVLVDATLGWQADSPNRSASGESASENSRARVPNLVLPARESLASVVVAVDPSSTATPAPGNRASSPFPDNLTQQSSQAFAPQSAAGTQVYINFDNVASGTLISNQYPPAIFSTDSTHFTFAHSQYYYGSSSPNLLDRGPLSSASSGFAPLYVDFTTPVNSLRFYLLAADELRSGIAQLKIFQNGTLTATRNLDGRGVFYIPVLIDIGGPVSSGGMGYDNVTRIEIVNITDVKGLGFDDFSFNPVPVPSPTPTPSPVPTPPAPPTALSAVVTNQNVSLSWTVSSGATGHHIKRATTSGGPFTVIAATPGPPYLDTMANGGKTHFYVVSALNGAGESPNSSQVSVSAPAACGDQSFPTPTPTSIHSALSGWDMTAEVSANDGVVLRDISLNGRYMAKSIGVPYFTLSTSTTQGIIRGELKPNSNDPVLRSRLIDYTPVDLGLLGVMVNAHYIIDRISANSDSCLHVTQMYWFWSERLTKDANGPCEPGGTLRCARFYPMVSYKFESRRGEVLNSFNMVQRNQFEVNGLPLNGIGLFRDCDSRVGVGCLSFVFKYKWNPLGTEVKARVIQAGQDFGSWDNIHETYNEKIHEEPGLSPGPGSRFFLFAGGCPECLHTHWRWGKAVPDFNFGDGKTEFYYPGSNQDVDMAIVKYKAQEQEGIEPLDYAALANNESIRLSAQVPDQVAVYFSATGHQDEDTFFKHLYFFNPSFPNQVKPINQTSSSSSESFDLSSSQDGPVSINYGHLYEDGPSTFTEIDPGPGGPLPTGHTLYGASAYDIRTEALVSGPHVVSFKVSSATDQSLFNGLRILHAEPDRLDPEKSIWVDRTILAPSGDAPDFGAKLIKAKVDHLGPFAIARFSPPPPDTRTADLAVTLTASADPIVADNNLTYTVTVTNNGPDAATGVGVIDGLPAEVNFISALASQGTCKFEDGTIYCKHGSLNSGAAATTTLVVRPTEGGTRFPPEGQINNSAFVVSDQTDNNQTNNSAVKSTTALPNPNAPPAVSITSPLSDASLVGPANVTVVATASDADGTVSQVNFYDNETLLGSGTPSGSNQFSLAWNNVGFGEHSLVAVVTDNGGRKNGSQAVNLLVNGTASVSITSPATGSVIAPHANLAISANASIPSGIISKVEFFANSTLLGTVNSGGQGSVTWNDAPNGSYSITAVVTDGSGVKTKSTPVNVVVSNAPSASISSPQEGMSFGSSPVVSIKANVEDDDSVIDKVSFYANGTLLGTGFRSGLDEFSFTWRGAPDGIYSLTARVADKFGLLATSAPVNIGVNAVARPGEFIWFDDSLPSGATPFEGDEGWHWADANPGSLSGQVAHQSRNFAQLDAPSTSLHQHYFMGATAQLPLNAGDKLFTYVFLDINNLPREIMLQWHDGNNWRRQQVR